MRNSTWWAARLLRAVATVVRHRVARFNSLAESRLGIDVLRRSLHLAAVPQPSPTPHPAGREHVVARSHLTAREWRRTIWSGSFVWTFLGDVSC
jgi:hypothetical protein